MATQKLIAAVSAEEFPEDRETLITFAFDKCRDSEECGLLLGLYYDIVCVWDGFREEVFQHMVEAGELKKYILEEYNQPSFYFDWFKSAFSARLS